MQAQKAEILSIVKEMCVPNVDGKAVGETFDYNVETGKLLDSMKI